MNILVKNNTIEYDYNTYGNAKNPSLLIMPSWYLLNNNQWLMQIEYLKEYFHIITFSPFDHQNKNQVEEEAIYQPESIVEKAIDLLDCLKIDKVHLLGFYTSCAYALYFANLNPERVSKIALINNPYNLSNKSASDFANKISLQRYSRWKNWMTEHSNIDNYTKSKFFYEMVLNEFALNEVSIDVIGCSKIVDINFLDETTSEPFMLPEINAYHLTQNIKCPTYLIYGAFDDSFNYENYNDICNANKNFKFEIIENAAHMPHFFSPIKVNSLLYDFFIDSTFNHISVITQKREKKARALYIPSPVGLGHVQRDLALARELRKQTDIEVEWLLPKGPARSVLEEAGEKINPHSDELKSVLPSMVESSTNHKMNFFEGWQKVEKIRSANFMTFLKAVKNTKYNLWIGDEAWEVDHYLHQNPKMKTSPFVFLTDFIGWLPINKNKDSYEAILTKTYNFEMMKLVEKNPKVRDKALYIGNYFDIIDESFGDSLPSISDWAKDNFQEIGYLYSFNRNEPDNKMELYTELELNYGEKFIIVSVGGTIVGESLVKKAIKAWSYVYKKRPDLHCVIVLGPSIKLDVSTINTPNLIIKKYVKDLYKYFSLTELGIVQGGLGTTMELSIHKKPFLYFPLKDHCEQMYHVNNRLKKYHSGKCLDWDTTDEFSLANHILENLNMDTSCYFDHDPENLNRTASLILDVM